jgi:Tfp pilus assembly protein PilP
VTLQRLFLAGLIILPLTGCGNSDMSEMQDLKEFVKVDASHMRGMIEPPPEINLQPAIPFKAYSSVQQPFDSARLKAGHQR